MQSRARVFVGAQRELAALEASWAARLEEERKSIRCVCACVCVRVRVSVCVCVLCYSA
jgi:hypothetical protein